VQRALTSRQSVMPTDSLPGKGYAIRSNEAARIHHAARQRGGVDARGARPATENASSGLPFVRTARSHAASVLVSSVPCGLRELGWIRGSNVIIEYRFADSDPGRGWQLWRTNWSASAGCDFCPNPPSSPSRERRDNNHPEPRSAALFFSLRHQEVLITARHRGRGVAHPINTNLGIDRIQALFSHFGLD